MLIIPTILLSLLSQLFSFHPITPVPTFGTFENAFFADCQYATDANLVIAEFPNSKITGPDVVGAFNTYGQNPIGTYSYAGLWFLVNVGFDGHRASAITTIDESQVLAAANAGGVEVDLWEQALPGGVAGVTHDVAVIAANADGLTIVNSWYGTEQVYTWAQWNSSIEPFVISYSAVTW